LKVATKRTDFYNELSREQQRKYFSCTCDKFLPTIDNIYYSVFIEDDKRDNPCLRPLMMKLEAQKSLCMSSYQPQDFGFGLQVDQKAYKMYKYCLSQPDLYDIFILSYLPNDGTPRVLVQLRAYGLWTHGVDKMLADSFNAVAEVFESAWCKIDKCRESRIDYCYHTNIISNPEKIFSDRNIGKQMKTTMRKWHQTGRIDFNDEETILRKDYFALGERSSNNVFVRCYNKALEVIEQGYKGFFFELWYTNGLISFYDKFCFEYALTFKDYDYVHKAKLLFYIQYGTDERVKREFDLELNDMNNTMRDFERIAKAYMPEVTTVMNIEFETKRKFYYYSDEFIDTHLKYIPRDGVPPHLNRIYRITDNRAVFLDYLTSHALAFERLRTVEKNDNGEKEVRIIYAPWWERLRNTKLDGIKADEKLLRKYASELDELVIKKRFVNNVASLAVYADKLNSGFIEDISDMLANLNDNHAQKMKVSVEGEAASKLLLDYSMRKAVKEKRLKNRKAKRALEAKKSHSDDENRNDAV